MRTKRPFHLAGTLLLVALLLVGTVVPAMAAPPGPGNGPYGPVPVGEEDLLAEPPEPTGADLSLPAQITPRRPASLGGSAVVGAPPDPGVQALAALGETRVVVSVRLDKPSLSSVSRGMTPEQRVAYAAEVSALQDQVIAEIQAQGGVVLGRFTTLSSGVLAELPGVQAAKLVAFPGVTHVSRVRDYEIDLSETVPFIGAYELQQLGITGAGVQVAVLDTGIDYTHLAFGGPGTVQAWEEAYYGADPACVTGAEPQCANAQVANPALFGPAAPKVKGGYDWLGDEWAGGGDPIRPDPNPIDNADALGGGHGTHVADIIAGLPYSTTTVAKGAGVAPGADLWAFKVCSSISTACSGAAMLNAMDDAADLDNNPATYDPADVMNLSIGSDYGQPEDDTAFFTNQAVAYGIIMVESAGNGGDKPYIVGSPSMANGAISVAQTQVPSAKSYILPVQGSDPFTISRTAWQPWSVPLEVSGSVSGTVVYGNGDGTNLLGCDPFTADLTGRVALVDRGVCAISEKAANASAAGAVLVLIGLVTPDEPPVFSYGGGVVTIPALVISQADASRIKAQLPSGDVTVTASPDVFTGQEHSIVGSSSRGPRNNDSVLKPDIAAPGASISAVSGTGSDTQAFSGTSGAAPMVSGAAALLKGAFGDQFTVQQYKALLMNSADPMVFLLRTVGGVGEELAPVSRIGAGEVQVDDAYRTRLLAWDSTDPDPLTWTGSLSFRYQAVSTSYVATRTLTILNLHSLGQNVNISADFRYANDQGMGVAVTPAVNAVFIEAGQSVSIPVHLSIDAGGLRDWGLNRGNLGNNGSAFSIFEYDGYITISTQSDQTIHVPWHVLPKKVAEPAAARAGTNSVVISNTAPYAASHVEAFSLVDRSENLYNYTVGDCSDLGMGPGCNNTAVDLKEVGVRDWSADLNGDGTPEDYVEFAVTVWDEPYRSSQMPAEFDIYIDSNRDGNPDWIVFNYDLALNLSDGRNAVFVMQPGSPFVTPVMFTDSDFNSQNWILTVPAAAVGLAPGAQFDFFVLAFDGYFTGELWDCSPFAGGNCGAQAHTYTLGTPRFDVGDANLTLTVDPGSSLTLPFTETPGGETASPAQSGLLFLYREAPVGQESTAIVIDQIAEWLPQIFNFWTAPAN